MVDYSGSTPSLLGGFDLQGVLPVNGGAAIDLGTVTRNVVSGTGNGNNDISSNSNAPSHDIDAFSKVGKVGFGDTDIATDDKTLWLVNLNQRTLIAVDTTQLTINATVPNTVNGNAVKQYNILAGGPASETITGAPSCTNGDLRPFALGFSGTDGYLGVVCDASRSATKMQPADLIAYVLKFNPVAPTTFTSVISFPLNYAREQAYKHFTITTPLSGNWQRWTDSWNSDINTGTFNFKSAPQPILSDIEFAKDGSLVLGFIDRFSYQAGAQNFPAISNDTNQYFGIALPLGSQHKIVQI